MFFFINCRFDSKLAAPRHEFAKDQCSQHKFADILWWWMCFGACGASILHIVKQIDCFEGALPFLSLTDSLPPRLSRLPHLPHLRWVTYLTYLVIIPKKLNSERNDILWCFAMWRCLVSNLSCFIWFDVKISEDSSNEWAQVGMISLIKTSASSPARFDVKTSSARIPQTVHSNQRPGRMSERLVVSQIIWSEGSLFRTDYFQFEKRWGLSFQDHC